MTLRNKDGSIYQLSAPNPIMKSQEIWGEYVIHNMEWQDEKSEDKTQVNPVASHFKVNETFLSELDSAKKESEIKQEIKVTEIKPEIKMAEPEKVVRKEIVRPDPERQEVSESEEIEKIYVHVLPAKIKKRTDSLYGDSYQTIQYSSPTSFEGVLLNEQDLSIEIWTDIDIINVGSILYPKTNCKRWWRVQSKIPKAGGWILASVPSDYQPSFDL